MGDQLVTFDKLQQVGDVQQEEGLHAPQAIGTTWWSLMHRRGAAAPKARSPAVLRRLRRN